MSAGDPLRWHFGGMDADQLQRGRSDLLERALEVVREGWGEYHYVWSLGEVLGVALVLGDVDELFEHGETEESVLDRWAFDLWGLTAGEIEVNSGCPRTREFFDSLGATLRERVLDGGYGQLALEFNRESARRDRLAALDGGACTTEADAVTGLASGNDADQKADD